jgi:hypothetical protein
VRFSFVGRQGLDPGTLGTENWDVQRFTTVHGACSSGMRCSDEYKEIHFCASPGLQKWLQIRPADEQ